MKRTAKIICFGLTLTVHSFCKSAAASPATGVTQFQHGNVTNYETEGNLSVTTPVGCLPFKKMNRKLTPADLYGGLGECLKSGDYMHAVQMFMLADSFGMFDAHRIFDRSASQAIPALQMRTFQDLPLETKKKFQEAVTATSSNMSEACQSIKSIGYPDYYPRYMIQHGLNAFHPDGKPALDPKFDAAEAWSKILDSFLHCPK